MAKKNVIDSTMLNGIRKEENLEEGVYLRITYGFITKDIPIIHYVKISTSEIGELLIGVFDKLACLIDAERYRELFSLNGDFDKFYKKFINLFTEKNFVKPKNKLRIIINKLLPTSMLSELILTEVIKGVRYLLMDIDYCKALPRYVKIIRITDTGDELNIMLKDPYIRAGEIKPIVESLFKLIIDLYKSTNDGKMYALPD